MHRQARLDAPDVMHHVMARCIERRKIFRDGSDRSEYVQRISLLALERGYDLEINRIIWLEDIVEKLQWKHSVEEHEVLEVFENRPKFQRKEAGYRPGEDVYAVFGRTNKDRLLSVFFVYTLDKRAIIVSGRDMTKKERKKYVG